MPTGIKHGTVTVIINGIPNEVTTYRADGEYRDHRRPDSVVFVKAYARILRAVILRLMQWLITKRTV